MTAFSKTKLTILEPFGSPDDDSLQTSDDSVNSDLFHKICNLDEEYRDESYNVVDLSEFSNNDSDDSAVNPELFQRVIEFDEVFSRQLEDFTTPPKRKNEDDDTGSPNKSQRIESSES